MATADSSLVIGLSSSVLEDSGGFARPDGIGTYTREIERALIAAGASIWRIGSPIRAGLRFRRAQSASASFALPLPWLAAASSWLKVPVPLPATVAQRIDLYHATDLVVPRLAHTPVVATVYDAIPLSHPEWTNPRLRRLKNWLLKDWVRRADLVIAISEAAVPELMQHYRIPRARIRVVPLGVGEHWFEVAEAARVERVLRKHSLHRGYFLHVGTLQPRKNLDSLISAYERLPHAIRSQRQLVLVGKYGWNVEALRGRLEALQSGGRVVWLDYVEHDELRPLYAGAVGFVYPSLAEGFGLPMLEAMATGLRVVASDLPALREVGGPHADYVSPRDIDAIGDAMVRLHETDDDIDASIARRVHAQQFDWATCAARTLDVYRELVG